MRRAEFFRRSTRSRALPRGLFSRRRITAIPITARASIAACSFLDRVRARTVVEKFSRARADRMRVATRVRRFFQRVDLVRAFFFRRRLASSRLLTRRTFLPPKEARSNRATRENPNRSRSTTFRTNLRSTHLCTNRARSRPLRRDHPSNERAGERVTFCADCPRNDVENIFDIGGSAFLFSSRPPTRDRWNARLRRAKSRRRRLR